MDKTEVAKIVETIISDNYESEDGDSDVLESLLDTRSLSAEDVRSMLKVAVQSGYDLGTTQS